MRGSCLCEKIQFEIIGTLPKIYQCHCSLCRKQGGSSSSSAIIVDAENFRWLLGESQISSYRKATGFRSDFCSHCGSPVPNPLREVPYYWAPAGLLDRSAGLEIGAHLFVASKASWDAIPSNGHQYETMPDLTEFVRTMCPDTRLG